MQIQTQNNQAQKTGLLPKILIILTFLYVVSLTCSMAAMEISSWLLFFGASIYLLKTKSEVKVFQSYKSGLEGPIIAFLVICFIGLLINAPFMQIVYGMGRLRNFAIFFALICVFTGIKNVWKLVFLLLGCATVVSVYAIWQHYTGIDLWRHSNRALIPVDWGNHDVYSVVGFFNHHLTYGHSFMMILMIPWAALLLYARKLKPWQLLAFTFSFVSILTSLIFTYGRGVWIAVLVGTFVSGFAVSRKVVTAAVLGSIFLFVGLTRVDSHFSARAQSIFAANYHSNEDRKILWHVNLEMFRDNPLFGVGYSYNEQLLPEYYKRLHIWDAMISHAHNNYIQILATTGICGLLAYLIIFCMFLLMTIDLYRKIPMTDRWNKVSVLAALGAQAAFHAGGLTQFNFGDMKVQHQFFFWLALVTYLRHSYGLAPLPAITDFHGAETKLKFAWNKLTLIFMDPVNRAVLILSFMMVALKKWEPGGNLDTIWYSAVSKNIFESGNYFHFYISKYYFREIFDHMPMTYWVTATMFKIFGVSDFVARLYPIICSFLSYILVFKIGKLVKDRTYGLIALVAYAACFGASKWNGALMHDVPLTTWYLAAFYFFLRALKIPKFYYLSALFFGLGIFTKGPIIGGFALGVILWSLWKKQAPYLKERHFYYALLALMALILVPLFPALSFAGLDMYTSFILWKSSYLAPSTPARYSAYFVVILETATTIVVPYVLSPYLLSKAWYKRQITDEGRSIIIFAFFISLAIIFPLSIFTIKFPHYMLPFYPFMAIVAAYPISLLYERYPFNLPKFIQIVSIIVICLLVAFPLKTTGKRGKEVLNIVNTIKLDQDIGKKQVLFLGHYTDDMTLFQTFKFYGSLDVKPLFSDQLKDIDLKTSYLIVKNVKLPVKVGDRELGADQCMIKNSIYCVLTHRESVTLVVPDNVFPHEQY